MIANSTRRDFLAAGLALPAAGGISYRTLGGTGLKVSAVGFGCLLTSDPSVIERAADMGINFFDTARVYQRGNNERMVGAGLKSSRKNVILSSKAIATSGEQALDELDTSLKELGTDYLDIWFLHNKTSAEDLTDELIEAQQTAKKAGKIRFTGVSTHDGQESVIPAAVKSGHIDVIMTTYNFAMDQQRMEPLIKLASEAGIGCVAMKVMAGSWSPPGIPRNARELIKRPGVALAALKWVLRNPATVPIPSMVDIEQLEENFSAMSSAFEEADENLLAAHLEDIGPLYCRMCGQCTGKCPRGLPVADMLRILTYNDGYRQFPLARERFLELPAEVRSVRCKDCASCAIDCPNGVKVAERLSRAQELFA